MTDDLIARLEVRWERIDGAAATKINRILKERKEAATALRAVEAATRATATIWPIAAEILDGAMKIGRQAEPLDTALIQERMDRAREVVG